MDKYLCQYIQDWYNICRYQPSWECLECGTITSLVLKAMHFFLMTRCACVITFPATVVGVALELRVDKLCLGSQTIRSVVLSLLGTCNHPGHNGHHGWHKIIRNMHIQ